MSQVRVLPPALAFPLETVDFSQLCCSDSAYVPSAEEDSDAYTRSAPPPDEPAWVDGYGRSHYGSADAAQDAAAPSPDDDHARRSPWHGWNSDCDRR